MQRSAPLRERIINTPLWPGNYRLGMWVWLIHRLTGLALVLYVLMHIFVISFSVAGAGGAAFDQVMEFLRAPFFVVMEIVLMAAVLFHALNGIRILLFDLGIGVRRQKEIFWGLMVVAAVAWLVGTYFLFPLVLGETKV